MSALRGEPVTARAPQRGVSLLEVMIAVIILGIASGIMVMTSKISVTGQTRSKVYGDAATATKEVLENLQAMPIDSLSQLNNTVMSHSQGSSIIVKATARSLVAADVDDISALDTTSLRRVTLNTQFKNKAGAWVTKVFSTIVYRP
jgi:prepilin-type N-terminal cleavage/methylation domain-containing protein